MRHTKRDYHDLHADGVVTFGDFPSPAAESFPEAPRVPLRVDFMHMNDALAFSIARRIARHLAYRHVHFDGIVSIGAHTELLMAAFLQTRRKSRPVVSITHERDDLYSLDGPTGHHQPCLVIAPTTDDLRRYQQFAVSLTVSGWHIVSAIAVCGWGCELLHEGGRKLPKVHVLEPYEVLAGRAVEMGRVDNADVYRYARDYPAEVRDFIAGHPTASVFYPGLAPEEVCATR